MIVVCARMYYHAEFPSLPCVLHNPSTTSALRHPNYSYFNPSPSQAVENLSPFMLSAFSHPRAGLTYSTQLKISTIIIVSAKE